MSFRRENAKQAFVVGVPMEKIILELEQSLKKYPPIKAGSTPEPYLSPK